MYKSMTLVELRSHTHNFFTNISLLYTKHNHQNLTSFLTQTLCDEIMRFYVFEQNKPVWRCYRLETWYRIVDEKEKIEAIFSFDEIKILHNLLKDTRALKDHQQQKSVQQSLLDAFAQGEWALIAWKPYVVYDIETTFYGSLISDQHFEMAYSIDTRTAMEHWWTYLYTDAKQCKELCDFLLSYDWYIVGYNHLAFDNPVLIHNAWYGPHELALLNKKSIDPFLFLWKMTWRRMSLNNVAQALIDTGKTLSSGKEWEQLLKERKKTWNNRILQKVKEYCKNDVEITLWVFLYLITYKSIQVDDATHTFTLDHLFSLWTKQEDDAVDSLLTGSLFLD